MTDEKAKAAKPAAKPKKAARTEEELGRMRKAHERYETRHEPVTAGVGRDANGRITLDVPHDDRRGWLFRLGDAVGSRSDKFSLNQVQYLLSMIPGDDPSPDFKANSMLAAVDAVRPETEIEGMLAVQMAATHHLAMSALARTATSKTVQSLDANTNLATKMLRTYTTQLEALAKLRRGGAQKVTVEHVHVHEGGQAIVGNVTTQAAQPSGGGRGQEKNGHQPYGSTDPRALAVAIDGEVLRPDTARDAVPVARDEREDAMPDPRRRTR